MGGDSALTASILYWSCSLPPLLPDPDHLLSASSCFGRQAKEWVCRFHPVGVFLIIVLFPDQSFYRLAPVVGLEMKIEMLWDNFHMHGRYCPLKGFFGNIVIVYGQLNVFAKI